MYCKSVYVCVYMGVTSCVFVKCREQGCVSVCVYVYVGREIEREFVLASSGYERDGTALHYGVWGTKSHAPHGHSSILRVCTSPGAHGDTQW